MTTARDPADRIREILSDCTRRRAAGELIDEEQLIADHPDLMPQLKDELEKLRQIHEARDRHAPPTADVAETTDRSPSALSPQALEALETLVDTPTGVNIEGYDVVREIERGGQGVIYLAVQKETKRKVAIKLLLEGPYASESARRRFEREIELVAQLRHPNICGVFHSGRTADGQHFCVMDYVRGTPLNTHIRSEKPALEEALAMFAKVCDAVSYAHQRGVIHRDLKPSNILVDADGEPKLLDFGLAKQAHAPVESLLSVTGQFLGTLPYMSPEQTRGNPDEIDTRTDVYALGVILYEFLTGHYPYPVTGQMADVLRHVAETPPTPPTRRWTADSGISRRRSRSVKAGHCPIDEELQTIILKSLSKERERRYQSAGELARDIRHYLNDEPIEAKRNSGWYVLSKTLKRHRVPVGIAALFAVVVTGSAIGLAILYNRADRQRVIAEHQTAIAQAVNEFLNKDLLASVSPEGQGRNVSMLQVLDTAAANIAGRFEDQPLVEAAVRTTLGDTYVGLGEYAKARGHIDRGLRLHQVHAGPDDPRTLQSLSALARLYELQGAYQDAEPLCVQVLDAREQVLGPQHPDTLDSVNQMARLYFRLQRYDEAEALLQRALDTRTVVLGPHHLDTLISMNNLANMHWFRGRYGQAESLYRRALQTAEEALGPDHPKTIMFAVNLANNTRDQARFADAEALYRDSVGRAERVLGSEHPETLSYLFHWARAYYYQERFAEALDLDRRVLAARLRSLGEEHADTIRSHLWVAIIHESLQDFAAAHSGYTQTRVIAMRVLGNNHPITLQITFRLGLTCTTLGRYQEAEDALLEAQSIQRSIDNPELRAQMDVRTALIDLYTAWNKPRMADRLRHN